jgi:hypothetical protein
MADSLIALSIIHNSLGKQFRAHIKVLLCHSFTFLNYSLLQESSSRSLSKCYHWRVNNLASTPGDLGQVDGAASTEEAVLEKRQRVLGAAPVCAPPENLKASPWLCGDGRDGLAGLLYDRGGSVRNGGRGANSPCNIGHQSRSSWPMQRQERVSENIKAFYETLTLRKGVTTMGDNKCDFQELWLGESRSWVDANCDGLWQCICDCGKLRIAGQPVFSGTWCSSIHWRPTRNEDHPSSVPWEQTQTRCSSTK